MKIAVCFLSTIKHHFNVINLGIQACESKNHQVDIYEYINDETIDYKQKNNIIYFNWKYLKNKFNFNYIYINSNSGTKEFAGIEFLVLLDLYTRYKKTYDMYMFYEDDLSYFGKVNLFDRLNFNYDVIFQDQRIIPTNDWWWIDKNNNLIESLYEGLLNIYALSPNVIEQLLIYIQTYHAHMELLISTFILNRNFNINYINLYIPLYCTFLLLSNNEISKLINNKYELIHPVKTKELYNYLWQNLQ